MWFQVIAMVASLVQAQQAQSAAKKRAQQQANKFQKEQWDAYEKQEKERKDILKKELARKRARMGASGFSTADGSAGAIMQGMRTDAAEDLHESYQNVQKTVDEGMSSIQSNLLKASEGKQRGAYSSMGNAAGSIAGNMFDLDPSTQNLISQGVGQGLTLSQG